jgi:hypothetical protein
MFRSFDHLQGYIMLVQFYYCILCLPTSVCGRLLSVMYKYIIVSNKFIILWTCAVVIVCVAYLYSILLCTFSIGVSYVQPSLFWVRLPVQTVGCVRSFAVP